jgi:hypothetical protein
MCHTTCRIRCRTKPDNRVPYLMVIPRTTCELAASRVESQSTLELPMGMLFALPVTSFGRRPKLSMLK